MEENKIKTQGYRPCGCYETTYEDGRIEVQPCPPHGIMEAARLFIKAGNMLGAVGQRLAEEQAKQAEVQMAEAVKAATGPKGVVE